MKRGTIMVVEDDPGLRECLETFFKMGDFPVIGASDGVEALEQLEKVRPALILLDVNMPRMDGLELLRKLEESPDLQIPVIVMSANGVHQQVVENPGVVTFVRKPLDFDALFEQVSSLLLTSQE